MISSIDGGNLPAVDARGGVWFDEWCFYEAAEKALRTSVLAVLAREFHGTNAPKLPQGTFDIPTLPRLTSAPTDPAVHARHHHAA